jgi:hypothetical protein
MEILSGVIKKTVIIIVPAAVIAAFFEWKKLPLGIIAGAGFGILNLRGLVKNVEGFIGSEGLTAKVLLLSMFRLFLLFASITILIWLKLINILGLLFGFTVVFALILVEGLRTSKKGKL